MSAAPTFSVVVPTYNGARFVSATLDSLAGQQRTDFEVVVVDDGSEDATLDIVADHDLPVRIVRQQHAGVAIARNRGAHASTGTWLAFLDQDDLWHRSRLLRVARHLDRRTAPLLLTTLRKFGTSSDRPAVVAADPPTAGLVEAWVEAGSEVAALCGDQPAVDVAGSGTIRRHGPATLLRRTLSMTTSFFVHREHLAVVGGWSGHARAIDDWWLMANAARVCPVVELDQPTQLYRIHSAATSRSTTFWYAYATSLLALRYGGNFGPRDASLTTPLDNPTLEHLLGLMIDSDEFRTVPGAAASARHLAALLWPGRSLGPALLRSRLKRLRRAVRPAPAGPGAR